MAFYLNGNYVSDSFLRYNLLHNNKTPGISDEINGNILDGDTTTLTDEAKILAEKLGLEFTEVTTENLLNRLIDVINSKNINMYSTLTNITKNHLIAILYLLYEGRIGERQINQIFSATNYKSRTEILLSLLHDENSQNVDFFAPLFNHTSKMTNYFNPHEFESKNFGRNYSKKSLLEKIKETTFKGITQEISYGNYYYAPKGTADIFYYCDNIDDSTNTIYLPDMKYKSFLENNKFDNKIYATNILVNKKIGTPRFLIDPFGWVIENVIMETYFKKQTNLSSYITKRRESFLFKNSYYLVKEINPEYLASYNSYLNEIQMAYDLMSFLDNELEKDYYDLSFSERWWNLYQCNKKGYLLDLHKNSKVINSSFVVNIDNALIFALLDAIKDTINYEFEKRTVKDSLSKYIDTDQKLQIGFKGAFDDAIRSIEESKRTYTITNKYEDKKITNNFFEILNFNTDENPDFVKPLKDFFTFSKENPDKFDSYREFLSKFSRVYNRNTLQYDSERDKEFLKTLEGLLDLDILINDNKDIINFGTNSKINNVLKELSEKLSEGIEVTLDDLNNKRKSIISQFRDNYMNLKCDKTTFEDIFIFYIAKEILGNYLLYLFPSMIIFKNEGRLSSSTVIEKLSDVFNINDEETDESISLFGTYKNSFKIRHFILNFNTILEKINSSPLYNKMIDDPCNCNKLFTEMGEYAESLRESNLFIKERIDPESLLTKNNFNKYKCRKSIIGGD